MTPETETKTKTKRFVVNIEGTNYDWTQPTITPNQIRALAELPDDQPIIEVDLRDNSERTLAEDEIVTLRPGQGFGKKVRFQRG
jgi:hypothetical protein